MENKSFDKLQNDEISNIKSIVLLISKNAEQYEESYNHFLSILEIENISKFNKNEIILMKTFLSKYHISKSIIIYFKHFKGNYNYKINNIDFIFKFFLIQVFSFFENHRSEKRILYKLLNNYTQFTIFSNIFLRLYRIGLFKIYHYKIYAKTLLLLSIISDKITSFKEINILQDNSIKNSMFFEFSINITKLLFISSNNSISLEEEKAVYLYFEYINETILNNNIANLFYLQKYDEACFKFFDFLKIINDINLDTILLKFLLKLYTNNFNNLSFMYNLIEHIKNCLVNFHIKSQDELKKNSILLNSHIQLIQILRNNEYQICLKKENYLNEGFYLGNDKSGFFTKIYETKNSTRTFIFSFNLHPTNEKEYTIINFERDNKHFFSIKILKEEKEEKFFLFFPFMKKQLVNKIIILPYLTYIFIISFPNSNEMSINFIGGDNSYITNIEKINIGSSIKFHPFNCCIGCKLIYNNNKEHQYQLINTFRGYIGPFIYFQKQLQKDEIIYILGLKGNYGDFIFLGYNNENILKYIESDYCNDFINKKSYINSMKNLKYKSNILKEIIRTIYPSSFNYDDYYDKIDLIKLFRKNEEYSKNYSYYSEVTQKKLSNNIITVEGDFPKLQPNNYSIINNDNKITIVQHFNIYFHPFKNKKTISEFLKFDGFKLIILHLEYYFQILTKLNKDKEKGFKINPDLIKIM